MAMGHKSTSSTSKAYRLGEDKRRKKILFDDFLNNMGFGELKLTRMDVRKIVINNSKTERNSFEGTMQRWLRSTYECDPNANTDLYTLLREYQNEMNRKPVSARDFLFAIWSCCDHFVRQEIAAKLFACKKAVPIIVPEFDGTNLTYCPWIMQNSALFANETDQTSVKDTFIINHQFISISALQFGEIKCPTSEVLNKLLIEAFGCDQEYFVSNAEDCADTIWATGTVERIWYRPQDSKTSKPIQESFSLSLLREDSFHYEEPLRFCLESSDIILIFTNYYHAKDVAKRVAKRKSDSHVVFVVFPSDDLRSHGLHNQPFTVIEAHEKSPFELSQSLLPVVIGFLMRMNDFAISVEIVMGICETININIDELLNKCARCKSQAHSVVSTLQEAYLKGEEVFLLQDISGKLQALDDETLEELEVKTGGHAMHGMESSSLEERQRSAELSDTVRKFLNVMTCNPSEYFYSWLILYLKSKVTEIRTTGDCTDLTQKQYFNNKTLCIEYYFRELGLMFECEHPYLSLKESTRSSLLTAVAQMLLQGLTFEIVGSVVNQVPINFLNEVFYKVLELIKQRGKILTVSIFGSSRRNNVKLLNKLFGVSFTDSDRNPQGLQLQLVPTDLIKGMINCDYLAIIVGSDVDDTQDSPSSCVLTTSLVCLSNVIILNFSKDVERWNFLVRLGVSLILQSEEINGELPHCFIIQHCVGQESGSIHSSKDLLYQIQREVTMNIKASKLTEGKENTDKIVSRVMEAFQSFQLQDNFYTEPCSPNFLADLRNLRRVVIGVLIRHCHKARLLTKFTDIIKMVMVKVESENFYMKQLLAIEDELLRKLMITCRCISNSFDNNVDDVSKMKLKTLRNEAEQKFSDLRGEMRQRLGSRFPLLSDHIGFHHQCFNSKADEMVNTSAKQAIEIQDSYLALKSEIQTIEGNLRKDKVQLDLALLQPSLRRICDKNASPDFQSTKKDIDEYMYRKLKECDTHVLNIIRKYPFDLCALTPKQIKTTEDIYDIMLNTLCELARKNNYLHKAVEDLQRMTHERFEEDTLKALRQIKENAYELEKVTYVESATLHLFLCSIYIYGIHKSHLQSELSTIAENRFMCHDLLGELPNTDSYSLREKLKVEIEKSSYIIRCAEPLGFPNLQSKIDYFLYKAKFVCSDDDFQCLKEFLTVQITDKYNKVQVNVTTLKLMDRYLLRLLPEMTATDLESIFYLIKYVKLYVFSKTMAKEKLEYENLFDNIHKMIVNAPISNNKRNLQRAAALVHLTAWSSYFIALKRYKDATDENIGNLFNVYLETMFNISQHHLKESCYDLVATKLCTVIQKGLTKSIDDHLFVELRTTILSQHEHLKWKRKLLRVALHSLLSDENYRGFIAMLKHYSHFTEKWILDFISKEYSQENNSIIESIMEQTINRKVKEAISSIQAATDKVRDIKTRKLKIWINMVIEELQTRCNSYCNEKDLLFFQGVSLVNNVDLLSTKCIDKLKSCVEGLMKLFKLPSKGNEDMMKIWLLSLPGNLHRDLCKFVVGCTKQCLFCGIVCYRITHNTGNHEANSHVPAGIRGNKDLRGNSQLQHAICDKLVCDQHRTYKMGKDVKYYKDFKNEVPDWTITADSNAEPSNFWKYVFVKFNRQFADFYECQEGFPDNWCQISKDMALESLKDLYDVSHL